MELGGRRLSPNIRSYCRPPVDEPAAGPTPSLEDRIETVRDNFLDAVRIRLRSDVPVGILLSGGIDSSAIAAAADRLVPEGADLNLLSAVSSDRRFDESPHIDRVAAHLGRPVARVSLDQDIGATSLLSELKDAIWHNDAPVGSLSNLAHRRLVRLGAGAGDHDAPERAGGR